MSFQVIVIFHGVPAGLKLCGNVDEQDKAYLQTFYNQGEWDVPEFMKVERVANKMFYTFVKCNNVSAHDGRDGSYLGITLRMNYYYGDIQNIYSILKGVYKKLCVGTLVSDNGKLIKYLVSDFKDVGDKLEDYNKRIIDTIGTFTSGSDLQAIDQVSGGKGFKCVNLMECTESVAKRILVNSDSLKVSTYYASDAEKLLQSKYENKLKQAQQQYSQELQKAECQYNERVVELRRQSEQKERELHVGTKSLKEELGRLQKDKDRMQKEIESVNVKLSQEKAEKQRILKSLKDMLNSSDYTMSISDKDKTKLTEAKNHSNHKFALGRVLLLLVIILLLIVTNALMWRQSAQLGKDLTAVNTRLDSLDASFQGGQAAEQSQADSEFDPNHWRIDIKGKGISGSLKKGKEYDITIKPESTNNSTSDIPEGDWCSDQDVKFSKTVNGKAKLSIPRNFTKKKLTIAYVVNGKFKSCPVTVNN